jgi:hypothetical protein
VDERERRPGTAHEIPDDTPAVAELTGLEARGLELSRFGLRQHRGIFCDR